MSPTPGMYLSSPVPNLLLMPGAPAASATRLKVSRKLGGSASTTWNVLPSKPSAWARASMASAT